MQQATWGTTLFVGQDKLYSQVCLKWARSALASAGPAPHDTLEWEAKLEHDVFRGKYTVWATGASANAALLVALDTIKAECIACEPVVLYGIFAYLGFSGSNLRHSTSPVGNSDVAAASGGSGHVPSVVPLPYFLHATRNQASRDDAAIEMLRFICGAWTLQQRRVVAIVVEPIISWTGHRLSKHFLQSLRRLATELKLSLVFDEVLTAFRLTGSLYCFELELEPDVVVIGKVMGFGMALLRADLCIVDTDAEHVSIRRASTALPLFHLQFMHEMMLVWAKNFGKRKIEEQRESVVARICKQLGIAHGDIFGEGLLVCGPFFLHDPEILALQGAKNRVLLIAGHKLHSDVTKWISFDPCWKRNMDAMTKQLEQLVSNVEHNSHYRAARFFGTASTSAATENALWDGVAQQLRVDRKDVKRLFRHLGLVQSSRKFDNDERKTRTRVFSFKWPL